jgi:DNA-binding transcriptional ArsR family regulator
MFSPGHTLASITYVIGDAAFVHDTLFMPDSGTARADFPGGSAALWKSIQDILALPDETRIYTGHDYQPGGREPKWESTVAEQKAANTHMSKCKTVEEFVKVREARDKTLPMPKLILHALQINTNAGRLPEPEANGRRYLKIPLNAPRGSRVGLTDDEHHHPLRPLSRCRRRSRTPRPFSRSSPTPTASWSPARSSMASARCGSSRIFSSFRQPGLSQQSRNCAQAGLIAGRKQGKQVYYRLADRTRRRLHRHHVPALLRAGFELQGKLT